MQFGLQASDSYLVWGERDESLNPGLDDLRDTHDIVGMNLATNQVVDVASGTGNQTEPAISGSVVVWQDNAHSCATCEQDILGKDLITGKTFTVASGPVDQSHPTIDGRNVAWVEFDGEKQVLLLGSLDANRPPIQVDTVSTAAKVTLDRPILSNQYLVWTEVTTPSREDQPQLAPRVIFKAYDLHTGVITKVADVEAPILEYSLSDHRVVWSDQYLHFLDLTTGEHRDIFGLPGASPFISGNHVLWSATNGDDAAGLDIWAVDLNDKLLKPTLLVTRDGNQLGAVVSNDILAWTNECGAADRRNRIDTASLSALVAAPVSQPVLEGVPPAPKMQKPSEPNKQTSNSLGSVDAVSATPTVYPLNKGCTQLLGMGGTHPTLGRRTHLLILLAAKHTLELLRL